MQTLSQVTLDAFGGDDLRARTFFDKYSLRDLNGKQLELIPEESFSRVASEIASVEAPENREYYAKKFYRLLDGFKFIPGGRILFGAGSKVNSSLLNCYVIPMKEDSIEGIFDWCKEAARTYSYGGGVGGDISVLRPRGAPVNNSAVQSTGAVSFMEIMSQTTGTIGQSGRRGALMITISVDHPDIEEFIRVKNDGDRRAVEFANISVRLTDEFMEAVENDWMFDLRYNDKHLIKTVNARQLWMDIIKAARDSAEPGLIFWDTMEKMSTTQYNDMNIHTVNPCAEQGLEPYGCCCLGNLNLSAFVTNPFENNASVDMAALTDALRMSVRFLDNVLEYNKDKHALPQQKEASMNSRRIGVGFTGFADMLIKLGYKYDTDEAIEFTDRLFAQIKESTYIASAELAAERGVFPAYDEEKHFKSPFIQSLPEHIQGLIRHSGLRNACLLNVPPVGSGSILAGTSSGIEPIFALGYHRNSHSLSKGKFWVDHPLVKEYKDHVASKAVLTTVDPRNISLSENFVVSHDIDPFMRVKMQAAIQKHIDNAISSTINLDEDVSVETVAEIYFNAWKQGLKGVTIYREGSRNGILVTEKHEEKVEEPLPFDAAKVTQPIYNNTDTCDCGADLKFENGCATCMTCGTAACSV